MDYLYNSNKAITNLSYFQGDIIFNSILNLWYLLKMLIWICLYFLRNETETT